MVVRALKRTADSPYFNHFITAVILLAAVVVGLETYTGLVERFETSLNVANQIILWIFVAEIAVKMGAEGRRPWRYFLDPWNIFDFVIVALCFMPMDAQAVTVLRLLRLLRVLKLVKALPKLQILVGALLKSIPSMFYVTLLMLLMFYVYAVAGTFIFSANDPIHFGSLQMSMLSLFRAVTLEDWTDLMYIQMYGCADYGYDGMMAMCTESVAQPAVGAGFFVSFVLVGTMVVLNLFIGVIMNGMDEAKKEAVDAAEKAAPLGSMAAELAALHEQLALAQEQLERVKAAIPPAPSESLAAK